MKSTRIIAQSISVLLHPILITVYGLLVMFTTSSSLILLPFEAKRIILIIIAINTLALPLLMIPLLHKMGIVKSLQMHEHRERIVPLTFTLVPYIFSFYFLNRLPIMAEVSSFILGATIALAFALVITIWWKISLHMIGVGGLIGLFHVLATRPYFDVTLFFILAIVAAGFTAWARLQLNTHKPAQVYAGIIIGWISVATTMFVWS